MTIRLEKLSDLLAEGLDDLLMENWDAIETHRDVTPYAPDWTRATILERQGILKIIVARVRGEIAGYNAFMVYEGLHARHTTHAINDVIWVRPEHRGVGYYLVKASERILRKLGANAIFYNTKVHLPFAGALLHKMGYELVEEVRVKVFQ